MALDTMSKGLKIIGQRTNYHYHNRWPRGPCPIVGPVLSTGQCHHSHPLVTLLSGGNRAWCGLSLNSLCEVSFRERGSGEVRRRALKGVLRSRRWMERRRKRRVKKGRTSHSGKEKLISPTVQWNIFLYDVSLLGYSLQGDFWWARLPRSNHLPWSNTCQS